MAPSVTFIVPLGKVMTSGSTNWKNYSIKRSIWSRFLSYLELLWNWVWKWFYCQSPLHKCNLQCRRVGCSSLQASRLGGVVDSELCTGGSGYRRLTCCLGSATEPRCGVLQIKHFIDTTKSCRKLKLSQAAPEFKSSFHPRKHPEKQTFSLAKYVYDGMEKINSFYTNTGFFISSPYAGKFFHEISF